jgi:hypothetical protein
MSSKRVSVGVVSPLDTAGILLHMLNILGPGHHLFVSAVSKAWRDSYVKVPSAQMAGLNHYYEQQAVLYDIRSHTTLFSAIFSAPAMTNLASSCGLAFDCWKLQGIAGRVADIPTLRAAHELGLAFTSEVLIGAAESGSTLKLQWLHAEQACQLPAASAHYAARHGSIDVLRWLKRGVAFTAETCEGAAAGAHTHVLQFLRDEGCE